MKFRLPGDGAQVRTSGPGTLIFSAAAKLLPDLFQRWA